MSQPAQLTEADREALLRSAAELGAAIQEIAAAFLPAFQAITQQCAHLFAALQAAGYLDADGKPVRPKDRPAWQSP